MAAGLGYKEFTTGDVLTAADANGYLASQVVMVFANAAARTSAITSPQEGMVSYLKDTNATEYYSGSAWAAIGGGGGGGKVLQVVQASTTTETTVASTSFTDTALSLSITPTSATSKVLVIVNQAFTMDRSSNNIAHSLNIVRGSTQVFTQASTTAGGGFFSSSLSAINMSGTTAMTYLDSPATTSATTYKTQGKVNTTANGGVVYYQASSGTSVITLLEIGA